jgi:ubiquinone/menaquinone biosynthesis C-methylase UbiE
LEKLARERRLTVKTKIGDMLNLPYEDESFDCLLSYQVIYHTDSKGIQKAIGEIGRVLRPGAEFFITLISKQNKSYIEHRNECIDENTILKKEEPEIGVPHYYVDVDDIYRIFGDMKILNIRQIESIVRPQNGFHYHVLGRKE